MPLKCYICNYYDPKKASLFRIPDRNDEYSDRCGLWLKLLEEKKENMHRIRICADHFLSKKPASSGDYLNIDWVPSKNLGRFTKNRKLIEYYYRTKKKANPTEQNVDRQLEDYTGNEISLNDASFETSKRLDIEACTDNKLQIPNILTVKNITDSGCAVGRSGCAVGGSSCAVGGSGCAVGGSGCAVGGSGCAVGGSGCAVGGSGCAVGGSGCAVGGSGCAGGSGRIPGNFEKTDINAGQRSESEIFLFVNNAKIPLKKRRIEIEKINEMIFLPKEIQTELTSEDVNMLLKHYRESVEERNELLLKISTLVIDVNFFKGNDKKTRFFTGLTTWSLLKNFYELVEEDLPTHFNCKLSKFQMVVLTLMKLRLNLLFTDLGYRFQIAVSTASRYFHRCIYIFFKLFKGSKLVHWPSCRENLLINTPSYFRSTFKEQITIIVDCFELFIEISSQLLAAAQSFSVYKHHPTLKYLIGISTTGAIMFVSIGYGGRASDKKVSIDSGFINKIEEGDLILADKGFLIEGEVNAKEASLRIPCFVKNGNQLNPHEIETSRHYSSIRIHVERIISVLREKFMICSDVARMCSVSKKNDLFDNDLYDQIVFVCCCLVNICPSVVSSDFEI